MISISYRDKWQDHHFPPRHQRSPFINRYPPTARFIGLLTSSSPRGRTHLRTIGHNLFVTVLRLARSLEPFFVFFPLHLSLSLEIALLAYLLRGLRAVGSFRFVPGQSFRGLVGPILACKLRERDDFFEIGICIVRSYCRMYAGRICEHCKMIGLIL